MTTHEINLLIERYLDGETTPAEERKLALAVQREDRPAEWAIIAEMLGELTRDEAMWTQPQSQRTLSQRTHQTHPLTPPCEGGERSLSTIYGLSEKEVSAPLHLGRGKGWVRWGWVWWVRWAAAACIAIAFGLSYNIIKETPQKTAKTELPQPSRPQMESVPMTIAHEEPPSPELQHQQMPTRQPIARQNVAIQQSEKPLAEEQVPTDEPLHELEAQSASDLLVVAEVQEPTPPSEDFALCMALLAEVEARAIMLQQTSSPLEGIYTAATDALSQEAVTTSPRSGGSRGIDGEWNFLLDELLAYIQQQSNRPELSL